MFKKKYLPLILFILILVLGAYLRLYRISDYMGFLGDEGRDALIVKRMIVDHKYTLLGPITSVGLMHLGPAYYYFMAPFLWAFNLDPVGPAVMVALFSLATIYLIWLTAKEFFDQKAALVAAWFYAISPLVITHAHSSWNPNIIPFWAILIIYGLLKIIIKKNYIWLVVVGLSLGVIFQLHYVAFLFIPIIFCSLLLSKIKIPFKYWIWGILGVIITFSPFIIFELRHDFINSRTVLEFLARGGNHKNFSLAAPFFKIWDLSVRLFWRLIIIDNAEISIVFLLGISGYIAYLFRSSRKVIAAHNGLLVLITWFFTGIIILSLYTGSIYDYYLMFVFPLPFILTGIVFSHISKKIWGKILVFLMMVILSYFQLVKTPILKPPNRLVAQTREIARFVLEKTKYQPYNFALIAGRNSDHAYRYFLEISGQRPVVIENPDNDPQRLTVTKQLLVVCEEEICQPLGHALWEIAGFGPAEIQSEWQAGFVKVFKLIPYPSGDVQKK